MPLQATPIDAQKSVYHVLKRGQVPDLILHPGGSKRAAYALGGTYRPVLAAPDELLRPAPFVDTTW